MTLTDEQTTFITSPAPSLGWSVAAPSTVKVTAALVRAQARVHAAGKSGDNKFDKYTYSKLEDFLAVAKPVLAVEGLGIVFDVVDAISMDDRTTKNGGMEHVVRVKIRCTIIHDSGETLYFYGYGEGQDRADKAIYKAMTGGKKYALAGALAIPTSDDPEADEKVGLSSGRNREKLDSDGNAQTKIPKWTDAEKLSAGTFNTRILALLVQQYNGNDAAAHEEFGDWKNRHKYDQPADVLKALERWENDLKGLP